MPAQKNAVRRMAEDFNIRARHADQQSKPDQTMKRFGASQHRSAREWLPQHRSAANIVAIARSRQAQLTVHSRSLSGKRVTQQLVTLPDEAD